jgi:hypothetical protein
MKKSMSDVRKIVEAFINRLLGDMEIATRDETTPQVDHDRMQFSWQNVKSPYKG